MDYSIIIISVSILIIFLFIYSIWYPDVDSLTDDIRVSIRKRAKWNRSLYNTVALPSRFIKWFVVRAIPALDILSLPVILALIIASFELQQYILIISCTILVSMWAHFMLFLSTGVIINSTSSGLRNNEFNQLVESFFSGEPCFINRSENTLAGVISFG